MGNGTIFKLRSNWSVVSQAYASHEIGKLDTALVGATVTVGTIG